MQPGSRRALHPFEGRAPEKLAASFDQDKWMVYHVDCRWFSGYNPCQFKRECMDCPHYSPPTESIAILSLEAMGAVLRTTCLLPAIKRRYPQSHITWITLKNTKPLLEQNPL